MPAGHEKSRRIPLGEAEPEGRASGGAAAGRRRPAPGGWLKERAGVCPEREARAFAERKSLEGCVRRAAPARPRRLVKRKEPAASYSRTGGSRTTLGDGGLDFRVRNGNGYFSPSVATGRSRRVGDSREPQRNREGLGGRFRAKLKKLSRTSD